jgi:hypothetical protein
MKRRSVRPRHLVAALVVIFATSAGALAADAPRRTYA